MHWRRRFGMLGWPKGTLGSHTKSTTRVGSTGCPPLTFYRDSGNECLAIAVDTVDTDLKTHPHDRQQEGLRHGHALPRAGVGLLACDRCHRQGRRLQPLERRTVVIPITLGSLVVQRLRRSAVRSLNRVRVWHREPPEGRHWQIFLRVGCHDGECCADGVAQ